MVSEVSEAIAIDSLDIPMAILFKANSHQLSFFSCLASAKSWLEYATVISATFSSVPSYTTSKTSPSFSLAFPESMLHSLPKTLVQTDSS